jgi:CheY-like chemotaxis protein
MNTGPLTGKTILVLETNLQIRQTVSGMLRIAGAREVLTASAALGALETLGGQLPKIDLFLCPFAIDQGNGFMLMRRIRAGIGKVPRTIPCAMLAEGIDDKFTAIAGRLGIGFVFSLPIAGMKLAMALAAVMKTPVQERPPADYQKVPVDWAPAVPQAASSVEKPTEMTAREAALAESRKRAEASEVKVEAGTIDQPVTLARDLRNGKGVMIAKAKEMVTPKSIARLIEQGMIAPEDSVFVAVSPEEQQA